MTDLYPDLPFSTPADADSFPAAFDLRDRGVVPPVRFQSPWGTCWTFGTSAACETSLLSMLGLTTEGYLEKYGVEMDLSERHLAWFSATPLPPLSDYPEGEYPYDASQAGEGARRMAGEYPLMQGGTYLLSASCLAAGIGVVAESIAPYQSNDGAEGREADWSLPEEYRFLQSFQLKNTNVLPSPAGTDADGGYVYRPAAAAAIKRELIRGRGVAIAYTAGSGKPDPPKEERRAYYENILRYEEIPGEDKEALIGILLGDLDPETLPDGQLRRIVQFRCAFYGIEEGTYAIPALPRADLALLSKTGMLGRQPDEIRRIMAEEEENRSLFFIGEDPVVWAQYSKTRTQPNHGACIVGWDDAFPASSFPEGHRPPADGAWICRNSYSEDWGMRARINASTWMNAESKQRAMAKLDDLVMGQIVPPGGNFDCGPLLEELRGCDTLMDAAALCIRFDRRCLMRFTGEALVRENPYTGPGVLAVGGAYLPDQNMFFIGAPALSEGLCDYSSRETLLGSLGTHIGHELSHGYDSLGARYDTGNGPLFTEEDDAFFTKETKALAAVMDRIDGGNGQMLKGEVQVYETMADLTGMTLMLDLAKREENFDYDAFFRAFAAFHFDYSRGEDGGPEEGSGAINPHAPYHVRVNFTLAHFDEFYATYPAVTEGTPMYLAPEDRILVW